MSKRILVPVPLIHESGAELLAKEADVVDGTRLAEAEIDGVMASIHGIYSQPGVPEPMAVGTGAQMDRAPQLEVIGVSASGFDWVDTAAASERGIAVVYAAGAQFNAVAEHGIGMMLALAKRIAVADRSLRRAPYPALAHWTGDEWPGFPEEIDRKTVGILGFGFIGRDLAHKCRTAFNMEVLAYDPYADVIEARRQGVTLTKRKSELPELLRRCDFVCLTLPLSDETRHIVGASELAAMRPGAYLVNLSRGGTVDEDALVRALEAGTIAGAGIDVFDPEPARQDHPLFAMENTVVSPHIAGWVREAMPRLVRIMADGMHAVLRGERPERLANPEVLPSILARAQR